MKAVRVAFGILAAALATPAALAVIPWAVIRDRLPLYTMMATPVALFITMAFGAPYVHRLEELGRATAWRIALTGAVVGALPFLLFDGYVIGMNMLLLAREPYTADSLMTTARWAGLGSWCGAWSALTYWAVAISGRRR